MIAFGSVLAIHIPSAWKLERNLFSGISMLTAVALLAVTGWLLYYAPGDSARAWASYSHMAVGFAGPLVLLWHLAYRKRLARGARSGVDGARSVSPGKTILCAAHDLRAFSAAMKCFRLPFSSRKAARIRFPRTSITK